MSAFFSSTGDGIIAGVRGDHQTIHHFNPRSKNNVEEDRQNTLPRNVSHGLFAEVIQENDISPLGGKDCPEQIFEVAPRLGHSTVGDENSVFVASAMHNESEGNIMIIASNYNQEDNDIDTPTSPLSRSNTQVSKPYNRFTHLCNRCGVLLLLPTDYGVSHPYCAPNFC